MTARRSGRLYREGPQPTEQNGRERAEKKRAGFSKIKTESARLGNFGDLFPWFSAAVTAAVTAAATAAAVTAAAVTIVTIVTIKMS